MDSDLQQYIEAHIDPEPALLHQVYRQAYLTQTYPHMCTDHLQGRLLAMLSRMIRPERVLELGAFMGYSTICLAEGLAPGGSLTTVEIDDEKADWLTDLFARAGLSDRIELVIGDALQLIPTLAGPWDLAYIDANKRHYCQYYDLILPQMRPGGYIIADNVLWGGKAATDAADPQTAGIAAFNDMVAADPRVDRVILPVRDGLTLIRVKD